MSLRIVARDPPTATRRWLSASLRRVLLVGARIQGTPDADTTAQPRVSAQLVEGDYAGALASLERAGAHGPRFDIWRAVALSELARWERASELLQPLIASGDEHDLLVALMHTRPERMAALIQASAGASVRTSLLVDAWGPALESRENDLQALRVLYSGLSAVESNDDSPRDLLRYLVIRGDVHAALGMTERARRDREAALTLLDDPALVDGPDDVPGWRARTRAELQVELAAGAAQVGDTARARELINPLIADEIRGFHFRDQVRARPEFSAMVDTLDL